MKQTWGSIKDGSFFNKEHSRKPAFWYKKIPPIWILVVWFWTLHGRITWCVWLCGFLFLHDSVRRVQAFYCVDMLFYYWKAFGLFANQTCPCTGITVQTRTQDVYSEKNCYAVHIVHFVGWIHTTSQNCWRNSHFHQQCMEVLTWSLFASSCPAVVSYYGLVCILQNIRKLATVSSVYWPLRK